MNFRQVSKLGESFGVSERDEDDSVMSQGAQCVGNSGLLSTSWAGSGNENTSIFTSEGSGLPKFTGRVPECLPLSGEVAVTSRNSKEERIVGGELIGGDDGEIGLGWCVHLCENFLRKRLGNPGTNDKSY